MVTPAAPEADEADPNSVEARTGQKRVLWRSRLNRLTPTTCGRSRLRASRRRAHASPPRSRARGAPPLTIPELRYLRLRYWDGAQWQDSWSGSDLPRGIEVTLALEPVPPDAAPGTLPGEVFRRVIAIPAGLASSPVRAVADDFESGSVNGGMTSEGGR